MCVSPIFIKLDFLESLDNLEEDGYISSGFSQFKFIQFLNEKLSKFGIPFNIKTILY